MANEVNGKANKSPQVNFLGTSAASRPQIDRSSLSDRNSRFYSILPWPSYTWLHPDFGPGLLHSCVKEFWSWTIVSVVSRYRPKVQYFAVAVSGLGDRWSFRKVQWSNSRRGRPFLLSSSFFLCRRKPGLPSIDVWLNFRWKKDFVKISTFFEAWLF